MKQLYLRLDTQKYKFTQIHQIIFFFKKFFSDVIILDMSKQRKELDEFVSQTNSTVISLDKFLPLKHNIDSSRVHDINGNYLHHNIKYNGRLYQNLDVVLYDHDIINGVGIGLVKALLESQGCRVSYHSFFNYTPEDTINIELLDFDDFLTSGLVVKFETRTGYHLDRVKYHANEYILEKKASIPKERFQEFVEGLESLINFLTTGNWNETSRKIK